MILLFTVIVPIANNQCISMPEYRKAITKEEVNTLPIYRFTGRVHLISSVEAAEKAESFFTEEKIYGLDTETKPVFKKGVFHPVSLLQIANEEEVFIFRLKRTGLPDYIISLLENKNIVKAGIDLLRDIKELGDYASFNAQSIIDLNAMAKKLGFESVGAKKLSALLYGQRISKSQQTSNWETPILSKEQITYAATDAIISRKIYVKLKSLQDAAHLQGK